MLRDIPIPRDARIYKQLIECCTDCPYCRSFAEGVEYICTNPDHPLKEKNVLILLDVYQKLEKDDEYSHIRDDCPLEYFNKEEQE